MPPHVVIVGCGFGGLWAAQGLRRAPVRVTVVDRTNHHLFTPLLYQVATAGLSAPATNAPMRRFMRSILMNSEAAVAPVTLVYQ